MVYAFITSTRNKGLEILLSRVFHVILLFLSYRYIVHSWGWMGFGKGGGEGGCHKGLSIPRCSSDKAWLSQYIKNPVTHDSLFWYFYYVTKMIIPTSSPVHRFLSAFHRSSLQDSLSWGTKIKTILLKAMIYMLFFKKKERN